MDTGAWLKVMEQLPAFLALLVALRAQRHANRLAFRKDERGDETARRNALTVIGTVVDLVYDVGEERLAAWYPPGPDPVSVAEQSFAELRPKLFETAVMHPEVIPMDWVLDFVGAVGHLLSVARQVLDDELAGRPPQGREELEVRRLEVFRVAGFLSVPTRTKEFVPLPALGGTVADDDQEELSSQKQKMV